MVVFLVTACVSLASGGGVRRRAASWQRIRLGTHDRLVDLVAEQLVNGPRSLPAADVHADVPLGELPASYGLSTHRDATRRPDLVAADCARNELLFLEVTIVPDAAVGRYAHRKLHKYADLCRAEQHEDGSAWRRSLDVVAVGTGGLLPPETWRAFARILQCEDDDHEACQKLAEAAVAIAAERPDAPRRRGAQAPQPGGRGLGGSGSSRRQRRRQRAVRYTASRELTKRDDGYWA